MHPSSGNVLRVTSAASIQLSEPMLFRVVQVDTDWSTRDGWVWLDGYELSATGDAVVRRTILVEKAGLHLVNGPIRHGQSATYLSNSPAIGLNAGRAGNLTRAGEVRTNQRAS